MRPTMTSTMQSTVVAAAVANTRSRASMWRRENFKDVYRGAGRGLAIVVPTGTGRAQVGASPATVRAPHPPPQPP